MEREHLLSGDITPTQAYTQDAPQLVMEMMVLVVPQSWTSTNGTT